MRQAERIIVNALSNYAVTIVSMLASIVLLGVVVEALTRTGFGMAALILAPFGIFQLLSNTIGRGLHRYIPQDLASNDRTRVNTMFNTALCAYIVLGLLGASGLWFARGWLLSETDLDAVYRDDADLAMVFLCGWMVIGLPARIYQRGLEAIQRYDILSAYNGGMALSRALILIPLFWLGYGSITLFVASQFVLNTVVSLLCRRSLMRRVPELKESIRFINLHAARLLAAFAAGTILVIAGNILATEGFKVFVGKLLSYNELGGLAAILTLTAMMWRLINDMTNVFTPAVSALDARGSQANISKLLSSGTKYSVLVAASICLVPMAITGSFFKLWLGDEFVGLEMILYIILFVQIPLCSGGTAVYVMMGLGKLRVAGPIVFVRSGLGILLAYVHVTWIDRSLTAAVAWMFGAQALGGLMVFLHCCGITRVSRLKTLAESILRPTLIGLAGALVTWTLANWTNQETWPGLFVSLATGEFVFLGLTLILGLNGEERARASSFLSSARIKIGMLSRQWGTRKSRP